MTTFLIIILILLIGYIVYSNLRFKHYRQLVPGDYFEGIEFREGEDLGGEPYIEIIRYTIIKNDSTGFLCSRTIDYLDLEDRLIITSNEEKLFYKYEEFDKRVKYDNLKLIKCK